MKYAILVECDNDTYDQGVDSVATMIEELLQDRVAPDWKARPLSTEIAC